MCIRDRTYPPYSATIRDGVIYGRGVSDNKCGAIASLYALKALKDAGIPFRHQVRLIFGCSEETGLADLDYYFQKMCIRDSINP